MTGINNFINQLIAAEGWPAPDLLQAILEQGEAAVAPLMAILNEKDSPVHEYAAQLLSSLNAPQAIPAIARLFYWYAFDILEVYADVLGAFGPPALDAALSLVTDPQLDWYQHAMASEAAKQAAGTDPILRAKVGEVLRAQLANLIARADIFTDDDYDAVGWLISDLAELADAEARPLIDAAFAADLVDETIIDRTTINRLYQRQEPARPGLGDWLAHYRYLYANYQADLKRNARREAEPPPRLVGPTQSAPKPGRNEPCWCGSGKKSSSAI